MQRPHQNSVIEHALAFVDGMVATRQAVSPQEWAQMEKSGNTYLLTGLRAIMGTDPFNQFLLGYRDKREAFHHHPLATIVVDDTLVEVMECHVPPQAMVVLCNP
jgi:hypothetical protein